MVNPTAKKGRGRPLAALRRRPLPALPSGLAGYLVALVLLATGVTAYGMSNTPVRAGHLVTWAALLVAGVVCLEVTRAGGQPAGLSRDLLSAWKIPVALLLPPVYALITPTLFVSWQQRRVRPGMVHRRVLSAGAIGLADGAASVLFHWLAPTRTAPVSWFLQVSEELRKEAGSFAISLNHQYVVEGLAGLADRPKAGKSRTTDDVAIVLATVEPPPERLGVTPVEPAAGPRTRVVQRQGRRIEDPGSQERRHRRALISARSSARTSSAPRPAWIWRTVKPSTPAVAPHGCHAPDATRLAGTPGRRRG